jgi:hypothetical protein
MSDRESIRNVGTMTTLIHSTAQLDGQRRRSPESVARALRIATAALVLLIVLAATIAVSRVGLHSGVPGAWEGGPSVTTTETTTTMPTPPVLATSRPAQSTRAN